MKSCRCIIYLFVLLFLGCTNNADKIDDQGKEIVFLNNLDEFVERKMEFNFIPLESCEESLIGMIDKVEIFEDRIYILDVAKARALFVFNLRGDFITRVGKQGNGPEEYNLARDFSIDKRNRRLLIDDANNDKLLYYDIDNYHLLKTIHTPYQHTDFEILPDNSYGWFSTTGIVESKNRDYFLLSDSLFNMRGTFLEADFKSGYNSIISNDAIYNVGTKSYVYHSLKPEIYEITPEGLSLRYSFRFENKDFPPFSYLKKISANNANFVRPLMGSDYINTYGVYETNSLVCIVYFCKSQIYIAMYDKIEGKRYHSSYLEFIKKINLGIPMNPLGKTDECLIGKITPTEFSLRNIKNEKLRHLLENVDENSNPILCLFKF